MRRSYQVIATRVLIILCTPVIGWSQGTVLTGTVKDRADNSPIKGANVLIGKKPVGTSGVDGKYSALIPRGTVHVTYRRIGYGEDTADVAVGNRQVQHDARLLKDTVSTVYWQKVVGSIGADGTDGGERQRNYADLWKQIDASGIAPEAKASAAQEFSGVIPSMERVPESLQAYRQVDKSLLPDAATTIDRAIAGSGRLPEGPKQIPGVVAADLAAAHVTTFEKNNHQTVRKDFYKYFNAAYGPAASTRLKGQVLALKGAGMENPTQRQAEVPHVGK